MTNGRSSMRVSREWLVDFETVVTYMGLTPADVEECKDEAREHPEWAKTFYPGAAAQIRERLAAPQAERPRKAP